MVLGLDGAGLGLVSWPISEDLGRGLERVLERSGLGLGFVVKVLALVLVLRTFLKVVSIKG